MPPTPDEFARLKERVNDLRRQRDEAAGALREVRRRMKEEFGVDTRAAAEALRKKLAREAEALGKQLDSAMAEFAKKWGDRL